MATVRDRVVQLCNENGITPAELEKKLILGNGIIGKWEYSKPRTSTIAKVAKYFSVSIEYLLYGTEPAERSKMLLEDVQEIDFINMLRKLDSTSKYYIIGQLAALVREKEKEDSLLIADPSDEDMAEGALSASRVG